jgi:hypothetical protein
VNLLYQQNKDRFILALRQRNVQPVLAAMKATCVNIHSRLCDNDKTAGASFGAASNSQ